MLRPFAILLLSGLAFTSHAHAQDLTDDELLQRFQAQRDAFRAARMSENGQTRGLTLVTVDEVGQPPAVDSASPGLGTPDPLGAGTQVTATPEGSTPADAPGTAIAASTAADTAPQPVSFGKLDPEMQVNMRIAFDFDSAALREDQKPRLQQLCKVMKASDIQMFRIVGHTDTSGSSEYNQKLSQLRADEVVRFFTTDCGIAPTRLEAIGLGESFPADAADPKSAANRRVEFQATS